MQTASAQELTATPQTAENNQENALVKTMCFQGIESGQDKESESTEKPGAHLL